MIGRVLVSFTGILLAPFLISADAPKSIDLPGDRLFPESVSITPDGTAYMGSMTGGVVRVSLKTGKAEQWIKPGTFGSGALFGVVADTRNNIVWTCSNDFSSAGLIVPGADVGHFVKGFDLRTGEGKVSLSMPGEKPVCNDFAVAKDGSVFITDTGAPRILRWRPGAKELEIWIEDKTFDGPDRVGGLDGLAFAGDGKLYVNNVRTGDLYRVDVLPGMKAGKVTKLTLSRPLASPDGMRAIGGDRLALAEGKGRIAELVVNGDQAEVHTLAEGIASPTGVAVYGKSVWYVQGLLAYVLNPDKKGQTPPLPFHLTPVAMLAR